MTGLALLLLFFAPVIAGTIVFYREMADEWLPVLGGIVIGTFAVLAVAGLAAKALAPKGGDESGDAKGAEERAQT